ncbi:MAG: hypothetical protein ACLTMR_12990 [Faecalibacillus sp.]
MYTYPAYSWLVAIIVLKDGIFAFCWLVYLSKKRKTSLAQAEMPGKIATAVFFVVSILLIAFYIPGTMISTVMIYSTVVLMIIMIYYSQGLYRLYKEN